MNKDERIAQLAAKLTDTGKTEQIWAKGSYLDVPICRAPTELLYLNDDNRRFRAEAQGAAAELGRGMDPTSNPDDELSIISLLLDRDPHVDGDKVVGKPSKETKALLADWEKRGQERPFWIRPDGLVVNGNRRLAMINRQQTSRGAEFSEWVKVIVFPEDEYDDDVLFDLEAREQLTEGLKVRYSDINVLLTLRDAAVREEIDWADADSTKKVAARIQHLVNNDPSYAEIQLNAIKYMDLYLEDLEKPGEYHQLQGMVERFREVGKTMSWIANEDPSREDAMLNVLFAAVSSGSTNLDVRDLRKLLKHDPEEFDRTIGYVRDLEDEPAPEPDEPEPVDEEDEEDEDEIPEPSPEAVPAAPDYPKQAVKRALDTAIQGVRDAKRNDKRAHVLSAAKRLAAIGADDLRSHLGTGAEADRLREALNTIVAWADEVRELAEADQADAAT